jgi:hypothetical protein
VCCSKLNASITTRQKRIKGCDLYVVQLAVGDGEGLSDSRPCHLCLGWLRTCGVKRVFFSVKTARHGAAVQLPPSIAALGPTRWMKQVRVRCAVCVACRVRVRVVHVCSAACALMVHWRHRAWSCYIPSLTTSPRPSVVRRAASIVRNMHSPVQLFAYPPSFSSNDNRVISSCPSPSLLIHPPPCQGQ